MYVRIIRTFYQNKIFIRIQFYYIIYSDNIANGCAQRTQVIPFNPNHFGMDS